jgi:hypothetical protein
MRCIAILETFPIVAEYLALAERDSLLLGVSNSLTAVSIKVNPYAIMVAYEPIPKISARR